MVLYTIALVRHPDPIKFMKIMSSLLELSSDRICTWHWSSGSGLCEVSAYCLLSRLSSPPKRSKINMLSVRDH